MEPNGGNFYKPHMLMVTSGEFWRCKHGLTSLHSTKHNCWWCAIRNPKAFYKWHFPKREK